MQYTWHCTLCGIDHTAPIPDEATGDALKVAREQVRHSPPTEMSSLREIKQRLAAIEQGQGVLCERLDVLAKTLKGQALFNDFLLGLLKPSEEPITAELDITGGKVVFTPSHTLKLRPKARRPRK